MSIQCNLQLKVYFIRERTMLFIIVCLLIQLAQVLGEFKSDITSESAIINSSISTSTVDNKYSRNMPLYLKKILTNSPTAKLNTEKWPTLNDRSNNKWTDHSPTSIIYKGSEHSTRNVADEKEKQYENEKRIDEIMEELKISREKSQINSNTNPSRTMSLSTKIRGDYNNGLKIVQYDDERIVERSRRQQPLAIKKRRQLSSPITSAQKMTENHSYIEVKDLPDKRIIPITFPNIDYGDSDGVEYYEEMDELLKIKKMLDNENIKKSNKQKQRGDMDPIESSFIAINDDEKEPTRGDIVLRNKRSHINDDNDDGDSDDDDELWGFAEDEGYVSSDEVKPIMTNKSTHRTMSNDQPINQLPEDIHDNQSKLKLEQEKKLLDYIEHNRPIVVPDRSKNSNNNNNNNNREKQQFQFSHSTKDQLSDNEAYRKSYNVMEQKQPTVSVRNYDDPIRMHQEEKRINNIPVSARIIIIKDPSSSLSTIIARPPIFSRGNFDNDIGFPGINPDHAGLVVSNFPVSQTQSPLKISPDACVWAIVQCCPSNLDNARLIQCFDYMGCLGVNWDPNPCRKEIVQAAQMEIINYYSSATRST